MTTQDTNITRVIGAAREVVRKWENESPGDVDKAILELSERLDDYDKTRQKGERE